MISCAYLAVKIYLHQYVRELSSYSFPHKAFHPWRKSPRSTPHNSRHHKGLCIYQSSELLVQSTLLGFASFHRRLLGNCQLKSIQTHSVSDLPIYSSSSRDIPKSEILTIFSVPMRQFLAAKSRCMQFFDSRYRMP